MIPIAWPRQSPTAIDDGADVVLTGGGNALDPLDPTIRALGDIGAEFVKFGAPAHPGSMFWLAYKGSTPIFSLASCSLYSRSTVADVVSALDHGRRAGGAG